MLNGLSQRQYDIFFSYDKSQSNEVLKFYRSIRNAGTRCCLDQYSNNRRGGESVFDESISGIRESRIFVFFDSPDYRKSLRCRVELAVAIEQNIPIVNLALFNFPSEEDNSETSTTPTSNQPIPSSIISNEQLRNSTFEQLESYNPSRYLRFDIDDSAINDLFAKENEHKLNEILDGIHELIANS